MHRCALAVLLFMLMAGASPAPALVQAAPQAEVVTNQTVVDMVSASLPTDVIITKIQTSKTNFDLSTDALVKLNQSAVPSEVVKAMLQKSSAPAAPAEATTPVVPADPNDPDSPHDPGIYVYASTGRAETNAHAGTHSLLAGKERRGVCFCHDLWHRQGQMEG